MKIVYRGPGDSVELAEVTVPRGATVEVTQDQYLRVKRSDPFATVDVVGTAKPETAVEVARIHAAQAKEAADVARERAKADDEALLEADRIAFEAAERQRKQADADAAAAAKRAQERADMRTAAAKPAASGKGA